MTSYSQLRSKSRSGHTRSGKVRSPISQAAPRGVGTIPAQLQRRLGNRGTQEWLAEQSPVQKIQKKDEPDELYGRKNMEGEELLQGKFDPMQLQGPEEEDELVQGKFTTNEAPAQFQGGEGQTGNRAGIPDPLKTGLEQLSGMDLSGVRVHNNSSKPAQLNALAYTQGQDIHVAPGQEKHLPHEGWHAVQQMQGRVQPTMQSKGVSINDDQGLEREADVMGAKALQMKRFKRATNGLAQQRSISFPQLMETRQELNVPGKSVQRSPAPIDEVKKVRSLQIEEGLKPGVAGAESLLKKKVASRLKVIDTLLEDIKPHLKQQWAKKKQSELLVDKNKSLKEILSTPDSKWVHKNHREQINKAHKIRVQYKKVTE